MFRCVDYQRWGINHRPSEVSLKPRRRYWHKSDGDENHGAEGNTKRSIVNCDHRLPSTERIGASPPDTPKGFAGSVYLEVL